MPPWPAIIPVFLLQEFASVAALLAFAYGHGGDLLALHFAWVAATFVDLFAGYLVGKWLGDRFRNARLRQWLQRFAEKWQGRVGKSGQALSLLFLGFLLYPYLAAFIAAWAGVSLNDAVFYLLLGNIAWYLFAWGAAIGLTALVPNFEWLIVVIISLAIALSVVFERIRRKVF
ncbi:MAG: hypothetical protein KGJ13_01255 [Patescibacteria group bacterium]|nr:hypothetical protein [Patescibacteria group bacterium]